MRIAKWMLALMALLACGLIAVGCGDDDDDSSSSSDEPATEESAEASAEGSTPEDVLAACEDVIEGTAAEEAGQAGCEAAADAFEQCLSQSEDIDDEDTRETAVTACQNAADQAVEALESAPTAE